MWLAALLSLAFIGPPEAGPIERYLATLQPVCDAGDYTPQYEVFDCWPDETPRTVVAMYTGSECEQVLSVIRVSRGGQFRILATWSEHPYMLELLDLTGNGVPEILVRQPPGRYARIVILHWDGVRLKELGETYDLAHFVDLDHDGFSEIIEPGEPQPYLYQLTSGRYVQRKRHPLVDVRPVTKNTDARERYGILVAPGASRWRIRAVNGERGGARRASRIALGFRGKPPFLVATGADEFAEASVRLPKGEVELILTTDGPAGSTFTLLVEKP